MRILIAHSRYRSDRPSGENEVVDTEAGLLAAAGHVVERYERSSDDIASMPLRSRAALPLRQVWSPSERVALRGAIDAFGPDVVHVHNTFPMLSASVLAACADARIPVVATLHNFRLACANPMLVRDGRACDRCVGRAPVAAVRYGCYKGSRLATVPVAATIALHRRLRTWSRSVAAFVAPSVFVHDVAVRMGLPASRIVVRPHAVPEAPVRRSGPGRHLLFLGRMALEKGVDVLLDASEQVEGARLVLAGDGPMRPVVETWVAGHPGTTLIGGASRSDARRLLAGARALVVPSRQAETFGLVVAEAFAAGVPVVAAEVGALPEMVEHGRTGWLVPPGDVAALAGAIRAAATDDGAVLGMGARARMVYDATYAPPAAMAALEAVYRQVAREGSRARA